MTIIARSLCILLISATIGAEAADTALPADSTVSARLLRALRYADTQRATITGLCQRTPELKKTLAACHKAESVPDDVIENLAIPYVSKYISKSEAHDAIAFWESPSGKEIVRVMLIGIKTNNPNLLSNAQLALLDQFNHSEANSALIRFGKDSALLSQVIRTFSAYEP